MITDANNIFFTVDEDVLIKRTYIGSSNEVLGVKSEFVIKKEAFIECYKKWIEGDKDV